MPEPPIPSPTRDRRCVAEPVRRGGPRSRRARRSRRRTSRRGPLARVGAVAALVVLVEQTDRPTARERTMPSASPARTATPRAGGPQRAAPFGRPTRPPDGCCAAWQPGLTARWSRSLRSRCFWSLSAGWCSTSATYPRRGRAANAATGSQRRHAQTPAGEDRGSHHRAPPGRADRAPVADERGTGEAAGRPSPADDAQAADRPPTTTVIADRHVATARATAITRGDARPRGRVDRSPPRGKHPRQHTNRRAAGRAAA